MEYTKSIQIIIDKLLVILNDIENKFIDKVDISGIQDAVAEVNSALYYSQTLKIQKEHNFANQEGYQNYINEVRQIIEMWQLSLSRRNGNFVDGVSWEIYEYFKYVPEDIIFETVKSHFDTLPKTQKEEYLTLQKRYTYLTGKIDFIEGDYSLIAQCINVMSDKIEAYRWLYDRLSDYRSKCTLNGIIRYWFDFDLGRLHSLAERVFPDYYDLDIITCDENEVMVDLGAYIGDSALDFIGMYNAYKKIYAYEITPNTFETLCHNIADKKNVILRQKGVSSERGTMYLSNDDYNLGDSAGNKLVYAGNISVEVTTLDEDIHEPITLIKMDIEGAEKDALLGSRRHIMEEKPKLMISAYHLIADMFDIPDLIYKIRDDYKFYIRLNGCGIWPCDYVLYAV